MSTTSIDEEPAAFRVWRNLLVMDNLVKYLSSSCRAQICLSSKQGCIYAFKRLWTHPKFPDKDGLELFSAALLHKPLFRIENHRRYANAVRSLDFSRVKERRTDLTPDDLVTVLNLCKNVTSINFSKCRVISASALLEIFEKNRRLAEGIRHFCMGGVNMRDQRLGWIVSCLPNLRHLEVPYTMAYNEICLALVRCCPDLRTLNLYKCPYIGPSEIRRFHRDGCPKLHRIDVRGCYDLPLEGGPGALMENIADSDDISDILWRINHRTVDPDGMVHEAHEPFITLYNKPHLTVASYKGHIYFGSHLLSLKNMVADDTDPDSDF